MKDISKETFSDFESGWQKAFEDAEMSPGKEIWNNIDVKLANKETKKYKRKIGYYKWLAAASVIFAIALSYFSLNNITNNNNNIVTNKSHEGQSNTEQVIAESNNKKEGSSPTVIEDQELNSEKKISYSEHNREQSNGLLNDNKVGGNEIAGNEVVIDDKKDIGNKDEKFSSDSPLSEFDESYDALTKNEISNENKILNSEKSSERTVVADNVNHKNFDKEILIEESNTTANILNEDLPIDHSRSLILADRESQNGAEGNNSEGASSALEFVNGFPYSNKLYAELLEAPNIYSIPGVSIIRDSKENKAKATGLWAGLNVGSSLFDPKFQEGSNFQPKTSPALFNSLSTRESAPQEASFKESTDPGISYSLGVNFGVRITEKWVVQSGVAYAQRRASTNSTTTLQNGRNTVKSPAYLGDATNDEVSNSLNDVTQDYQLMNSFEFISVPLKAGYLIVDRKIGIMVLGGVSADVFLSNTLSETDDKLSDVKVEAGSDSPFRNINFNGVIGAELSYEISKNYHLTLEPNYGIALNSFTKSSSSFTSNPQTFGLSAGLKFYLK